MSIVNGLMGAHTDAEAMYNRPKGFFVLGYSARACKLKLLDYQYEMRTHGVFMEMYFYKTTKHTKVLGSCYIVS